MGLSNKYVGRPFLIHIFNLSYPKPNPDKGFIFAKAGKIRAISNSFLKDAKVYFSIQKKVRNFTPNLCTYNGSRDYI